MAGVDQLNESMLVYNEITAELMRVAALAKCLAALPDGLQIVRQVGGTPRAPNRRFKAIGLISFSLGVMQKREGGACFLQPDLAPI